MYLLATKRHLYRLIRHLPSHYILQTEIRSVWMQVFWYTLGFYQKLNIPVVLSICHREQIQFFSLTFPPLPLFPEKPQDQPVNRQSPDYI